MRRVDLTYRARSDADEIFIDGVERFGYAQAVKFRTSIFQSLSLLAEQPLIGEDATDIANGARIFRRPFPCKIIYRFDHEAVVILRIYHGRQDYERLLG